jgi:hypothetical protein
MALRLLNTRDTGFRLIVSFCGLAGLTRRDILARIAAAAMKRAPIQRVAFRTVSQIGITYRGGPLCAGELPDSAAQAGDRFPWIRVQWRADGPIEDLFQKLDDTRWSLLIVGQEPSAAELPASPELLQTYVLPRHPANDGELARVGIPMPSFYLIRPDGHVGLCGTRLDPSAIPAYLRARLRIDNLK